MARWGEVTYLRSAIVLNEARRRALYGPERQHGPAAVEPALDSVGVDFSVEVQRLIEGDPGTRCRQRRTMSRRQLHLDRPPNGPEGRIGCWGTAVRETVSTNLGLARPPEVRERKGSAVDL